VAGAAAHAPLMLAQLVSGAARLLAEPPFAVAALEGLLAGVQQEEEGGEMESRREVSRESRESKGGNAVTCRSLVRGAVLGSAGAPFAVAARQGSARSPSPKQKSDPPAADFTKVRFSGPKSKSDPSWTSKSKSKPKSN
jgi:hypothetical protein